MSSPSSSVVVSKLSVAVSLVLLSAIFLCVAKFSNIDHSSVFSTSTSYLRASKLTASLSTANIASYIHSVPSLRGFTSAEEDVMASDDVDQSVVATSKFLQHGVLANLMADNVVFGLAAKSTEANFAIFVGSLMKHSNSSDAVVFVEAPAGQRFAEIARQAGVVMVEYSKTVLVPATISKFHPSTLRWILFDQFMSQNEILLADKYEKVMFADAADTAFQADPFEALPAGAAYAFQDGSVLGTPISQNQGTSSFIHDCFGEKILTSVQEKPVVNVGVTLASYEKGRYYVKLMSSILQGESGLSQNFPACERAGVDQGVHNVVVHLGLVEGLEIKSEAEYSLVNIRNSEVWNNPGMQVENLQTHTYDRTLNVINIQPLAVVHEYDVVASLSSELAEKYVYWKDFDDAVGMWHNEKKCALFNAFVGVDANQGQAEIGAARVMSARVLFTLQRPCLVRWVFIRGWHLPLQDFQGC